MPDITDFNLDQRNGDWTTEYSDGSVKTGNIASSVATVSVLAETGRSGWIYGAGVLHETVLTADAVTPGSRLSIYLHLAKYAPYSAGSTVRVLAVQGPNSVVLMDSYPTATLSSAPIRHEIVMSWDRKWAHPHFTISMGGAASMVASDPSLMHITQNSTVGAKSPRAKAPISFSTYSAPPTVETVLINWALPVTLRVQVVAAGAGDCHELLAFSVTQHKAMLSGLSPKFTRAYGDSLTEGAGSTTANDWLSVWSRGRAGTPVINEGLGGQTSAQVIGRALCDGAIGTGRVIWWVGANDSGPDGLTWWAAVNGAVQQLVAARGGAAGILIGNLHIATNWSAAYIAAANYVNAQLATTYGSAVADIYSQISPGGVPAVANYSDTIHLNDAGYALVARAFADAASAQGWA